MRYMMLMRTSVDRTVLTVTRHDGGWAVEREGDFFGQSSDKEAAKAAANREARRLIDEGRACQVCISGETGFFTRA